MANMSKAALETAIRNDILTAMTAFLSEHFEADVMDVSASELTMPVVDAEGNEKFALIKVSIPRGTRNGDGGYDAYDGYAAAEEWKGVLADRTDKEKARQEKREQAEKERERKRAAKAVVKELNEKGLNKMVHEEG